PKPVPATPGRPVDTASNSFVWSRGSGVFWQAVHACRGHGPRGDGPLCGWHVRGCNGSGRHGRGRLAGPAVAPAECSAGLARVQCDLWKDESQHNRSSTSSWEARDEWCPGDWPGKTFFFTTMAFRERPRDAFRRFMCKPPGRDQGDYVMWAISFPDASLPAATARGGSDALLQFAKEQAREFHVALRQMVDASEPGETLLVPLRMTPVKGWSSNSLHAHG